MQSEKNFDYNQQLSDQRMSNHDNKSDQLLSLDTFWSTTEV